MICQNCKINIDHRFGFAIRANNCPGCGKQIMAPEQLATYIGLIELLVSIGEEIDINKIVSVIMVNFELKQKSISDINDTCDDIVTVEDQVELEEEDPDAENKDTQKKEAKKILQKLRDEALEGAIEDKYGMDGNGILLPDDPNIHEVTNSKIQEQRRDVILSGLGGENSFSRSQ